MLKRVKAFAPATVANIACGFDILGFAMEQPGDEVILSLSDIPGVRIKEIHGNKESLSCDVDKNCATLPIVEYLKYQNLNEKTGIDVELFKNLPLCSGMGSSAASSVVGVYAANRLLGDKLTKSELLPFILKGEELACGSPHADNAAPSLLGGITLIRDYSTMDIVNIDFPESLYCTLIHPDMRIDTITARRILPLTISLAQHVKQSGNLAGLIAGLMKKDISLISRSFEDIIAEPVRSGLIPSFKELRQISIESGAIGFSISGSGPSLFALSENEIIAKKVAEETDGLLNRINMPHEIYISKINKSGAVILEEE